VLSRLRRDAPPDHLSPVFTRQVRGEERGRVVSCRKVYEAAHARADFGADLLQLLDLANGRIESTQPAKADPEQLPNRPGLGPAEDRFQSGSQSQSRDSFACLTETSRNESGSLGAA
jgi:hypothetical protein